VAACVVVSGALVLASCGGKNRAPSSSTTANASVADSTGACPPVPPPPDAAAAPWIWASTVTEDDPLAGCEGTPQNTSVTSDQAREHWKRALIADDAGRLDECVEEGLAGIRIEPNARAFLHLASCEARSGKTIEALRHADRAYADGRAQCDGALVKLAAKRVQSLSQDAPRVVLKLAPEVAPTALRTVSIDGASLPAWVRHDETLLMNPGVHEIAYCVDRDGTASQRSVKVQLAPHAEAKVTLPP
jgi:hypothetical protein